MPPIFLIVVRCAVFKFMWAYGIIVSLFWPILASLYAFSFPSMLACALTLYNVMDCILCCKERKKKERRSSFKVGINEMLV